MKSSSPYITKTRCVDSNTKRCYHESYGSEAGVELLLLPPKAPRHLDAHLQARAGHDGKEVGDHQLQRLESDADQVLSEGRRAQTLGLVCWWIYRSQLSVKLRLHS